LPLLTHTQPPLTQLGASGLAQTWPHDPQFAGSAVVSLQAPAQHNSAGSTQAGLDPHWQTCPTQSLLAPLQSASTQQLPAKHSPVQQIPAALDGAMQAVRSGSRARRQVLSMPQRPGLQAISAQGPQLTG
jgi:hypothetical protein